MKILAIDTSGIVAGVGILENDKILAEINVNYKQNHSVTLMPMIDNLLKMVDMELEEIDYIACCCGPGSFTGLRIGAATAKAISHALNKKIIPISTLEMLAYNIFMPSKYIVPIIDAKGERVFTAIYFWEDNKLINILPETAMDLSELLEYIQKNDIEPIFLGDAALVYKEKIINFNKDYIFAPISHNMQKASSLCSISIEYLKDKKVVDYNNFFIQYLRKPQAERELLERENKNV